MGEQRVGQGDGIGEDCRSKRGGGVREEDLGCSSSMPAGTDTSSDTNTFITAATHRWAQTKGNAKRMHSFDVCTRFSSNQLPVTSYQLLLLPLCTQTCHSWRGEQCGQTMIVESKSDGCEYTS